MITNYFMGRPTGGGNKYTTKVSVAPSAQNAQNACLTITTVDGVGTASLFFDSIAALLEFQASISGAVVDAMKIKGDE